MYIPNQMRKQIARVFYDKTVEVLTNNVITDAEGGVNYKGYDVKDNFKGNVNFSNCKVIQEEYGLDYSIDMSITTNYKLLIPNDLIRYQDVIYKVTDIIFNDSHYLVVANKWRQ